MEETRDPIKISTIWALVTLIAGYFAISRYQKELMLNLSPNQYGIIKVYMASGILRVLYNVTLRKKDPIAEIKLPRKIRILIPHLLHEKADLDGWSWFYFIVNVVAGYLYPGEFMFVLLLSLITEGFEHMMGYRPRYMIDPIVNLVGYGTGIYSRRFFAPSK